MTLRTHSRNSCLQGCVDVYKAAVRYEIKGLAEAATAAFHQRSVEFSEHAELKRIFESGLPRPTASCLGTKEEYDRRMTG